MPMYRVTAAHRETGEDRTFEVPARNPAEASAQVNADGYVIAMIVEIPDADESTHADARRRGALDDDARARRAVVDELARPRTAPRYGDGPMYMLSFVCPLVGIIAGSVRMANRMEGGVGAVMLALLGIGAAALLWVGIANAN